MRATVRASARGVYHSKPQPVERDAAVEEFRRALLALSRSAGRGKRPQPIIDKGKDLQAGRNRACETVVDLLFDAQDNKLPLDELVKPALLLVHLLRTRGSIPPAACYNELHRAESDVEAMLNLVTNALRDGEYSTANVARARDLTERHIAALSAIRDKLNHDLLAARPALELAR